MWPSNTPGIPITVGTAPVGIEIVSASQTILTTTQLGVTPASPVVAGTQEILTATVSPSTAVGITQFRTAVVGYAVADHC